MKRTFAINRAGFAIGVLALIALGLMSLPGREATVVRAQPRDDVPAAKKEGSRKVDTSKLKAPPADVNDLSMQVAALRTLYLLKVGIDFGRVHGHDYSVLRLVARGCAQPPRTRSQASASKNYVKVLTELRAAFIVNNEDRINELSEQLEELTRDEEPDLDDGVEITEQARKSAPRYLRGYLDPNQIAAYIGAYDKEFPNPYFLIKTTIRADGKGKKLSPEQWKETRAFVIAEVSWQLGGLDPREQARFAQQTARILDRAYKLNDTQMQKEFAKAGTGLRGELGSLCNLVGSMNVIKNVVERDIAELFSNPQLLRAVEVREEYLKKNPPAPER
jgi:hypothetical protein